jgi:hypothetical protein
MATYYPITLDEMKEFLLPLGFKIVNGEGKRLSDLSNTVEIVFAKRIDTNGQMLSLRVFTGINPSGQSRGVGEDAVRVSLAQRIDDGGVFTVGGSVRVHRVQGWRKNLAKRINRWHELVGPKCPKCGKLMCEREGRTGKFWGCTQYRTGCKATLPHTVDPHAPSCPKCSKLMVRRTGTNYDFYGCSGYPECKATINITAEEDE